MKREPEASHPARPHQQEGRLILSSQEALSATNAGSKEGVMQSIGIKLNKQTKEALSEEGEKKSKGPKRGDRQRRSQRKSFKQKSGQRRKKFGR